MRDRLAQAARSGASYRELEAIAVLSGPPPPNPQAIPARRWSAHPDGYLLRIASQAYRRTTVQIVRPEPLQIRRDGRGRIARIGFGNGSSLVLAYRDDLGPLRHRAYPELTVWGFAAITYTPPPGDPRPPVVLRHRGWTVVSDLSRLPPRRGAALSREGTLLASLSSDRPGPLAQAGGIEVRPNLDPLEGSRDDLRDALIDQMVEASGNRTLEQLHEAHGRAEAYADLLDPDNPDAVNDLLDAAHVREGVVTVTVGTPADRLGFIADTHARLARALALARITALFDRDLPGGGSPIWDPPSTTGAPGGSGQIRGLSGREA